MKLILNIIYKFFSILNKKKSSPKYFISLTQLYIFAFFCRNFMTPYTHHFSIMVYAENTLFSAIWDKFALNLEQI